MHRPASSGQVQEYEDFITVSLERHEPVSKNLPRLSSVKQPLVRGWALLYDNCLVVCSDLAGKQELLTIHLDAHSGVREVKDEANMPLTDIVPLKANLSEVPPNVAASVGSSPEQLRTGYAEAVSSPEQSKYQFMLRGIEGVFVLAADTEASKQRWINHLCKVISDCVAPILKRKDIDAWGPLEVALWLESSGLGEYAEAFVEKGITGALMLELQKQDLDMFGITKYGHKLKFTRSRKEAMARLSHSEDLEIDNLSAVDSNLSIGVMQPELIVRCTGRDDGKVKTFRIAEESPFFKLVRKVRPAYSYDVQFEYKDRQHHFQPMQSDTAYKVAKSLMRSDTLYLYVTPASTKSAGSRSARERPRERRKSEDKGGAGNERKRTRSVSLPAKSKEVKSRPKDESLERSSCIKSALHREHCLVRIHHGDKTRYATFDHNEISFSRFKRKAKRKHDIKPAQRIWMLGQFESGERLLLASEESFATFLKKGRLSEKKGSREVPCYVIWLALNLADLPSRSRKPNSTVA